MKPNGFLDHIVGHVVTHRPNTVFIFPKFPTPQLPENMQRLPQYSDLYTRYVKKLDQQETELEKLHKEIESLKNTENGHFPELQNYVMNLDVRS